MKRPLFDIVAALRALALVQLVLLAACPEPEAEDAGPRRSSGADHTVADSAMSDANDHDGATPDTASADNPGHDSGRPDTRPIDSAHPDTAMPDAGGQDSARPDSGAADAASADSASADTAAQDQGVQDSSSDAIEADGAAADSGPPACEVAACNVPGPRFTLADTCQRACSDNDAVLQSCPAEGEAFFGQDAQYGWDTIHAATERFTRSEGDAPVVEDRVTGLVWQGCTAGLSGAACVSGTESLLSWGQAVTYCDSLNLGGHDDWVLPDPYALQSIVDFGQSSSPSVDPQSFPGTRGKDFWTSATYHFDSARAWWLDFGSGFFNYTEKRQPGFVRCVRSGSLGEESPRTWTPTEAPAGEVVVDDSATDLVWQGCDAGLTGASCDGGELQGLTWQEALAYCQALSWGGRDDWRLPSVTELASLIDLRAASPAIDTGAFPATQASDHWSSTANASSALYAWSVGFREGRVLNNHKGDTGLVRCVRGG